MLLSSVIIHAYHAYVSILESLLEVWKYLPKKW